MMNVSRRILIVGIALAAAMCGVAARAELDVTAVRGQLLLPQEPAGALTLAAAKQKLKDAHEAFDTDGIVAAQEELAKAMPYGWLGTNKLGVVARADLLGISDFTLPDGTPGQPMTSGHFFLKDAWLNV